MSYPQMSCVSLLLDPARADDCIRFDAMVKRLRAQQLKGDGIAGLTLLALSRGPRFMHATVARKLMEAGSLD
jgi:hypothetical protein